MPLPLLSSPPLPCSSPPRPEWQCLAAPRWTTSSRHLAAHVFGLSPLQIPISNPNPSRHGARSRRRRGLLRHLVRARGGACSRRHVRPELEALDTTKASCSVVGRARVQVWRRSWRLVDEGAKMRPCGWKGRNLFITDAAPFGAAMLFPIPEQTSKG